MGNSAPPRTDTKRRLSDQERLESWKAIANYLKRSVRTVRRWEASENLPVYRHQHTKGFSIYAYGAELDAWRDGHHQSLEREPALRPEPEKSLYFPTLARYAAVAIVAAFVGGILANSVLQTDLIRKSETTTGESWLLIAASVNHNGLEEIGDNLKTALRREISQNANHHAVLPQQRVEHALRYMRRDSRTELSPAIAKEVAMRDGRVDAVLIPHVEQLGESYVLSVEVTDPQNDLLIAYPSQSVNSPDLMLPAMERLVRNVGAELVDRAIGEDTESLPLVTTSSMQALRLYSQASYLLNNDQPTAAYELLDLAVSADAEFVSAQALKAWAMRRSGSSQDDYLPIAKAAAEFQGPISPQERYFIEGSYRFFSGDLNRADATYRALLEVQSDHLFGAQAMLELCIQSKQSAECVDEKVRVAKLRPKHLESNLQAAWALASDAGNARDATHFADKSLEILQESDEEFAPSSVARALIFPVVAAWAGGDVQVAWQKSQSLRDNLPSLPIETQTVVIKHLAEFSLALGRINEAKKLLELLPDAGQRYELQAGIRFATGDKEGLRVHLGSGKVFKEQVTVLFMSMSGFSDEAMALHSNYEGMSAAQGAVIRASVAIQNGRLNTARPELERAVAELSPEDQAFYFVGPDMLSGVLKAEGNLVEAISVLERTAPHRNDAAYHNAGLFWLMCQRQLAHLYREAGREYDAIQIENELRELLILADDDFPLLRSLNEA